MDTTTIHGDLTIAQILERVPGAEALFNEHGVDPVNHCAPLTHHTRLYVAASTCWLERVDNLLAKLRAASVEAASHDAPA